MSGCPYKFTLRVIFLAFFAVNAWNKLNNLDSVHEPFAQQYKVLHDQIEKKASFKIPEKLHHTNITENSKLVVQGLLWTQLFLIGVAALIAPSATVFVAFNHLVVIAVSAEIWNISGLSDLLQMEGFLVALALFAASLSLGRSGKKCTRRQGGSSEYDSMASSNM